jgi:trigger factor
LKTTVTKLDDNRVEITATVPADVVDKKIAEIYKEAAQTRIKGFRAGKAPRKVLENHYGGKEYFLVNATEGLVNAQSPLAIDAENLVPLGSPDFGEDKIDWVEEGKDFIFKFTISVTPTFELSSYDPVTIEMPSTAATETEIKDQLDALLGYYTEFEPIEGRTAQAGDVVILKDIDATINGLNFEPLVQDRFPYALGSGGLPAVFEAALTGANVGDIIDLEFEFDEAFEGYELGEKVVYKAEVEQVTVQHNPELTDEWVKETLEYEGGVAELNERIVESIESQKASELGSEKEFLVARELSKRLEGEPPEDMVKQIEQDLFQDLFRMLQAQNVMLDAYLQQRGLDSEGLRDDMHRQAVENASTSLALDAVARHIGLEATEDEVFEEFVKSGSENPQSLFDNWQKNGRLSEIRQGILRVKASKHVNDTALTVEPKATEADGADKATDAGKAEKADKKPAKKKATAKKDPAAKKPAAKKSTKKEPSDKDAV